MIARLKSTGAYVDVYKEGSVIGKNGVEGLYYRFGDTAKLVIYGSELVFEKDNEGQALLYAVEKTAERTKKEVIEKAKKYLQEKLYTTPIFEYDEDEEPIMYVCASCCDSVEEFISNFKQAMEE